MKGSAYWLEWELATWQRRPQRGARGQDSLKGQDRERDTRAEIDAGRAAAPVVNGGRVLAGDEGELLLDAEANPGLLSW